MPRFKPTATTDVIGSFEINPEDLVSDYLESLKQEKFFVKPPNADNPGDTIELLYIQNMREHESMIRLQRDMLENAKRQENLNHTRVEKIKRMLDQLRSRFIEVTTFLKECDDKKRVATTVVQEEAKTQEQYGKDIHNSKAQIESLNEFRRVIKRTVGMFKPYEKVLEDVVEKSDIYVSTKDCMDRCDALMLAQDEITKLQEFKIDDIERMRQRMIKVTTEVSLFILGLKNELAKLERSYNLARALCLKWEHVLSLAKDAIGKRSMEKERTLDAIVILYRMLAKRKNVEALIYRDDVEAEMDFIIREFLFLKLLFDEVEKNEGREGMSDWARSLC